MFAIDFVARSGGGLNEIDLKIYFHTYNVKKMAKSRFCLNGPVYLNV